MAYSQRIELGSDSITADPIFGALVLGSSSFVRITSLQDSRAVVFRDDSAPTGSPSDSLLAGSTLLLELFVAADSAPSHVRLDGFIVAERGGLGHNCGGFLYADNDDRRPLDYPNVGNPPLSDPRVGRKIFIEPPIENDACTASIVDVCDVPNSRVHLSAWHCFQPNEDNENWDPILNPFPSSYEVVLEFNVPLSDGDCGTVAAATADRFALENDSVIAFRDFGSDWAVFRCAMNSEGDTSYEHALAYDVNSRPFPIVPPPSGELPCVENDNSDCIRVTGFGGDGNEDAEGLPPKDPHSGVCCCDPLLVTGEYNHIQQTAVGTKVAHQQGCPSGNLFYRVDFCGGNSGSPVIVDQPDPTDFSKGKIVTHVSTGGYCGADEQPYYSKLAITDPGLLTALCTLTAPADGNDGVVAEGSHMLRITPPAGSDDIALYISSNYWDCPDKFVKADGSLGTPGIDTEVYQTPAQWGTMRVFGPEFVAFSTYTVDKKFEGVRSAIGCTTTWTWGEVTSATLNHNCVVDVDDLSAELDAFADTDPCLNYPGSNLYPCGDDCPYNCGQYCPIDVDDVLAMLDAITGGWDPCVFPCGSQRWAARSNDPPTKAEAILTLEVREAPLGTQSRQILVDVFVESDQPIRAFQLAAAAAGGNEGLLALTDIETDPELANFLFDGLRVYDRADLFRGRFVAALPAGAVTPFTPRYLATVIFDASLDAEGSFAIELRLNDTMLRGPSGETISIAPVEPQAVSFPLPSGKRGATSRRKE